MKATTISRKAKNRARRFLAIKKDVILGKGEFFKIDLSVLDNPSFFEESNTTPEDYQKWKKALEAFYNAPVILTSSSRP